MIYYSMIRLLKNCFNSKNSIFYCSLWVFFCGFYFSLRDSQLWGIQRWSCSTCKLIIIPTWSMTMEKYLMKGLALFASKNKISSLVNFFFLKRQYNAANEWEMSHWWLNNESPCCYFSLIDAIIIVMAHKRDASE